MTWLELKTIVKEKLYSEGDAVISIGDITSANAALDLRLKQLFQEFVREAYYFYKRNVAVTGIATSATEHYNVGDTVLVYEPERLYVSGVEVPRISYDELRDRYDYLSGLSGDAPPKAWARMREGAIAFSHPIDAVSAAAVVVAGWALHPTLAADNTVLQVPESHADAIATFIAQIMQEPVVADQVGLFQNRTYNKKALSALSVIKSRNLSDMYGTALSRHKYGNTL